MLSPLSSNNDEDDSNIIDLLYHLCKENEVEKVQNILPFIGNINIINKIQSSTGSTCLHVACYYGHGDMVKILLEYGALHCIRNLRHNLTPYEEATSDDIKQLFVEHQKLFSHNDYDYIEWSMVGDDLLEKRRKFRQAIDLYKTYDNHHLVSKLLVEVIHYYLNEYLMNQNNDNVNSKDEIIRKQIETIEGYFKEAIEKQDYLTYFVKAYTLTNFFYKVLNKDLALYILEYFDTTKTFSSNYRLVNCLVHIVTLLIHHPNLPKYQYQGVCYRGMRITKNDLDQYQLDQHILNRAFLSTSIDPQVAEMFAGVGQQSQMRYTPQDHCALQYSCLCRYLIKQKSTAIDVQSLSTRPDEKEILILPFIVFKVIAIKRNYLDDSTASISIEIELEECEDSNDDKKELESSQTSKSSSLSLSDDVIKNTEEYVKVKEQNYLLYGVIGLLILAIVGFFILGMFVAIAGKFSEIQIHGRISFSLRIFGILTSIVTIIVLQRKSFRTPTNLILQHVAFFDTVVLISYNIYSLYFHILHQPNSSFGQSQFWPRFAIFNINISSTAHSIALWLTCLLAIIRYTLISKPKQVVVNTSHVIILVWIVALPICLLMIIIYLIWNIVDQSAYVYPPELYTENSTETVYRVRTPTGERLEKIIFVIMALCFEISPVFILIIFSVLLILNIHHARQLHKRFRRRYSSVSSSSASASSLKRELRTTTMLVFITLFTALVELPQSLFIIGSGIDKDFFLRYLHLGNRWDIKSIGTSFITFIIYCLTSQQFRMEMYKLILPKCFRKKLNLKTNNHLLTNGITLKRRGTRTHTTLISPGAIAIPQDL
ncbi:unnamed protein product [Rotaria sordida]|uniref:G-protein coupled receptors family 1 profile domain-containing protein n=1 Tax=Rotaria sordida TaxID=392033 RepID=A0A814QX29_9BILA|nr:unnamed protein product [Rotaria sordida]CAF3846570.1 unnamed protein product [Rotaria sordida]